MMALLLLELSQPSQPSWLLCGFRGVLAWFSCSLFVSVAALDFQHENRGGVDPASSLVVILFKERQNSKWELPRGKEALDIESNLP